MDDFKCFPKISRLSREMVITEKIDGTNGLIYISDTNEMKIGSRSQWIAPQKDNHGFALWATQHKEELLTLGPGYHYGEWWGTGIQRKYDLSEKRFSLFRVDKWSEIRPACCHVVPTLYQGVFDTTIADEVLKELLKTGSKAAPGYMYPEGIVIFHIASRVSFKHTLDDRRKSDGPSV